MQTLQAGVVQIKSEYEGQRRVGAGIIVRLYEEEAYVVTAAHVIFGDPNPTVRFFSNPNRHFDSTVIHIEGGDQENPGLDLAGILVRGETSPRDQGT